MDKAQGKLSSNNHASCSGLPALFGLSHYETRTEYLHSRIQARKGIEPPKQEKSIHAQMGDVLEPVILNKAVELLGLTDLQIDHPEAVKHKEFPLEGSLDGIAKADNLIITPDNSVIYTEDDEPISLNGLGVLEAKATALHPETDGKAPAWRGLLQTKALCAILDYSWGCIATLHRSTDFKLTLIRRDFAFERELKEVILDFERRIVEEDYYPPVTLKDTQTMFSQEEPGKEIDLDNEIITYHLNRHEENRAKIKLLTEENKESQLKIQEYMGNAEIGKHPNFQATWGSRNYKAQPEKIIPAKDAYTVRSSTINIKRIDHEERQQSNPKNESEGT